MLKLIEPRKLVDEISNPRELVWIEAGNASD
jgi:hypothetical protein